MKTWIFDHIGPEYEFAQWEISGLCLRIGGHAWVLGRYDYRDKRCPWPFWARVHLTLGHKPYPERRARWALFMFGRPIFDFGGQS